MKTPKIILASASAQRKRLLRLTGLKFSVMSSKVKELQKIETTCAAFVQKNALMKARDIAQRVDRGLVIGADTVVYDGHQHVIGKPNDLKEAARILRQLFAKPHWVYTGIVIIDAETGKSKSGFEKTKVFMNTLSQQEIELYHGQTSPLDKAGGFDIEGRGGIFISRIEGCYNNVIGLPLAKLRMMLKDFGVLL